MERAILAEMAGAVLFSLATLLACSWRLCSSMRGRRLDAAVLSIVVSICVWGMAGTCCLLAGRFHPLDCSVLTILGAVGLLGIRALAGLTAPSPPSNRISRRAFVGCAALILLGIGLRMPPMDAALAGRDQGTYMLRAAAAARDGTIPRTHAVLAAAAAEIEARPGPADIVGLFPVDDAPHRRGSYEGPYRPGFYLADRSRGEIVPQFLHLFPALLGMTRWILPAQFGAALNVAFSSLWLLATFCVGLHVFRRELPALAWTATLCLDPLAIWVGRNSLTEPLDALLWMAAILIVVRQERDRSRSTIAAAACLGVAAFARGNSWLLAPLMLVSFALPTPGETESADGQPDMRSPPERRRHWDPDGRLRALAIWWVLLSSSLVIHAMTCFPYLHDELKRLSLADALTPSRLVLATCVASGVVVVIGFLSHRALQRPTLSRRAARLRRRILPSALICVTAILILRGTWLLAAPTPGLARLDLLWPALTLPVLGLALVGVVSVAREGLRSPGSTRGATDLIVGAIALAVVGQTALYALPTLPQSGLFYYGRYLLPQLLPLGYGLCVAGLFALARRIGRPGARQCAERTGCALLLAWVVSPLIISPLQRLDEYSASRTLIEKIADHLPRGSVVIAGGEGWLHAHTYNQVAGALELEHDVTVLPYRTREAAFASAMELLAVSDQEDPSTPPQVFLLLNEATKSRPHGPHGRRAVIDLGFPSPLVVQTIATFELFGHRLQRELQTRPTQVLRNEIRVTLAAVSRDPSSNARVFATTNADGEASVVQSCERTGGDWTLRLPAMESDPAWLFLSAPPAQRGHAKHWRVLLDERVRAVAITGETRAERSTLGPWLLPHPPREIAIAGATASKCEELLTAINLVPAASPSARPPKLSDITHHRISPSLGERQGYGDTTWVYGHVFNRFRLGAHSGRDLEADSIWLTRDHPLQFPPIYVRPGAYEVSLTLTGLDELRDTDTSEWHITVAFDDEAPVELEFPAELSTRIWTPTLGLVHPRTPALGLSVTLHTPLDNARVQLRDVTLIDVSGIPEETPSKLR